MAKNKINEAKDLLAHHFVQVINVREMGGKHPDKTFAKEMVEDIRTAVDHIHQSAVEDAVDAIKAGIKDKSIPIEMFIDGNELKDVVQKQVKAAFDQHRETESNQ